MRPCPGLASDSAGMAVTHRATRRIRLLAMLAHLAMPTTATGVEDTGGGEAPRGISAD